jgi:stearoyl-CoA desaturase (Delta-9 desaturase)
LTFAILFFINSTGVETERPSEGEDEWKWTWRDVKPLNTVVLIYLHIASIYGFFVLPHCWQTYLLQFLILIGAGFGVTAGSHRYFTHKSYRANKALRYFLIFLQTLSAQEDIIKWVRDHRVHHKFTDTNADPHNSKRGFFFSHMGWLFIRKHPEVTKFGKKVDMSDLENDPVLLFHKK